jgi:ketosteroid isomerase-like protein
VRDWIDAWNSHEGSRLGALYTEGATHEDVPTGLTVEGPEGVAGFADVFANNLVGGLTWELRSASRAGDRAAVLRSRYP